MTLEVIWGSGSPYAWRVLLTLEVKGLSYESRLIQFSRDDQRTPEPSEALSLARRRLRVGLNWIGPVNPI